ncbi:hypothetical protein BS78_10G130700 [Paspalum vaginatum]|nr:hypothetical protein BS78_10G130700 [Paspalum vaginatum]
MHSTPTPPTAVAQIGSPSHLRPSSIAPRAPPPPSPAPPAWLPPLAPPASTAATFPNSSSAERIPKCLHSPSDPLARCAIPERRHRPSSSKRHCHPEVLPASPFSPFPLAPLATLEFTINTPRSTIPTATTAHGSAPAVPPHQPVLLPARSAMAVTSLAAAPPCPRVRSRTTSADPPLSYWICPSAVRLCSTSTRSAAPSTLSHRPLPGRRL